VGVSNVTATGVGFGISLTKGFSSTSSLTVFTSPKSNWRTCLFIIFFCLGSGGGGSV